VEQISFSFRLGYDSPGTRLDEFDSLTSDLRVVRSRSNFLSLSSSLSFPSLPFVFLASSYYLRVSTNILPSLGSLLPLLLFFVFSGILFQSPLVVLFSFGPLLSFVLCSPVYIHIHTALSLPFALPQIVHDGRRRERNVKGKGPDEAQTRLDPDLSLAMRK